MAMARDGRGAGRGGGNGERWGGEEAMNIFMNMSCATSSMKNANGGEGRTTVTNNDTQIFIT